jgi:hypothetical protein
MIVIPLLTRQVDTLVVGIHQITEPESCLRSALPFFDAVKLERVFLRRVPKRQPSVKTHSTSLSNFVVGSIWNGVSSRRAHRRASVFILFWEYGSDSCGLGLTEFKKERLIF